MTRESSLGPPSMVHGAPFEPICATSTSASPPAGNCVTCSAQRQSASGETTSHSRIEAPPVTLTRYASTPSTGGFHSPQSSHPSVHGTSRTMQDRQLAKPPTDAPATAALPPERRELPCQSTHQLPRQPRAHAPPLAFRFNSWPAAVSTSSISSGCSVAATAHHSRRSPAPTANSPNETRSYEPRPASRRLRRWTRNPIHRRCASIRGRGRSLDITAQTSIQRQLRQRFRDPSRKPVKIVITRLHNPRRLPLHSLRRLKQRRRQRVSLNEPRTGGVFS